MTVARAAAAGGLTLPEAAAVFGWLNDQPPALLLARRAAAVRGRIGRPAGGWTEAECLCLEVVARAGGPVGAAGLWAEFGALRACGRPLVLPSVDPDGCQGLLERATEQAAAEWAGGRPPVLDLAGLRLTTTDGGRFRGGGPGGGGAGRR